MKADVNGFDESESDFRFLTMSKAASLLSVNVRSLYRWIADGKFPKPVKVNGKSLLIWSEFKAFVQERKDER